MARPITWRNVEGADLTPAFRTLSAAQQGMSSVFDSLRGTLDEFNQGRRDTNTQAFQDLIAKYRTPEELQAAMAPGGEIDLARQQYGQLIDRDLARTAPQAQLSTLRNQAREGWEYSNAQNDQVNDPVFQRIAALHYQGKTAEANALMEEYQGRKVGDLAKLGMDAGFAYEDQSFQRQANSRANAAHTVSQAINNFRLNELKEQSGRDKLIKEFDASLHEVNKRVESGQMTPAQATKVVYDLRNELGGHIGYSAADKVLKDAENNLIAHRTTYGVQRIEDEAQKAASDARFKDENIASKGSYNPLMNLEAIHSFIGSSVKDKGEAEDLRRKVSSISRKGFEVDGKKVNNISQSLIQAAILESEDDAFWGNNRVKNFERILKELLKTPSVSEDLLEREERRK